MALTETQYTNQLMGTIDPFRQTRSVIPVRHWTSTVTDNSSLARGKGSDKYLETMPDSSLWRPT